jgi:hypothetical protein
LSNGPPGNACMVTNVIPVTTKKTGINQSKRRTISLNMSWVHSNGAVPAAQIAHVLSALRAPRQLNRLLIDPPRVPVRGGERWVSPFDIRLGENREATVIVGGDAHLIPKHHFFHLPVHLDALG